MPTKAQKPATLKDEETGLAIVGEGKQLRLSIKNDKQAVKAINAYAKNEEQLEELLRKVAPLQAKKELIRAGMRVFQVEEEIKDFESGDWTSQLVERTASMWILDDGDIPEHIDLSALEEPVKPLDTIISEKAGDNSKLYRKLLNKVTRRTIDTNALDAAVKDGTFTAQEILPAYLQYTDTAYVQIKLKNKPQVKK